jgi:hypothetical protein
MQLASVAKEPVGRKGFVKQDPEREGRNLFIFSEGASL